MGRLFWKFFFAFWVALLVAGAGVGSAVWWQHNNTVKGQLSAAAFIDRYAEMFVSSAASVLQYGGVAALRKFLNETRDNPLPPIYAIDDENREILNRRVEPQIWQQARSLQSQHSSPKVVGMISADDGQSYLLFVTPSGPNLIDKHQPWTQSVPKDVSAALSESANPRAPLLLIVSGFLASLLFSAALAWYFARPIRSLRNAFSAVADGKLDTRVAQAMGKRQDELADLGRDFDHMAAQLESLISAQQRLLNDVSHELRSPLARMQAAIGLAQQQPEKISGTLERIEKESQRISDLVGELLVLSRLEAGVSQGETADTDIGDLLADIVEDARFEATQKGVEILYSGFEDVIVRTRCELLHRAVENVLRNAVRHCKSDGQISVVAVFHAATRRLRISIVDQGPGVPEANLQAIFLPFFRGGHQGRPDGVGLGLAIAQRAVTVLGGTIEACNRPEGGLQVQIVLPFQQV